MSADSELICFEYTTFPPDEKGEEEEAARIKVVVNRPQITVVMRFIRELTVYLGSFQEAARSESFKETSTPRGPLTRFDIDLMHPLLILPRSSRSCEAYVADLGRMNVSNSRTDEGTLLEIALHDMRLETQSERGHKSVVVPGAPGTPHTDLALCVL